MSDQINDAFAADFNGIRDALRAKAHGVENDDFAWDAVCEILHLRLTKTDVLPERKVGSPSKATAVELTAAVNEAPNKVFDFFPTLAFSELHPDRRIAVRVRWRNENASALAQRFPDLGHLKGDAGWNTGIVSIRRNRDRNEAQNPGVHIGFEGELAPLRRALAEGDVLAFVRRHGQTSYEAFGVAKEQAGELPSKKMLLVRPSASEPSVVWQISTRTPQVSQERLVAPAGRAAQAQIDRIVEIGRRYGSSAIVALAGVPGTGKTFASERAALQLSGSSERVEVVQFHAAYAYEEFVEGMDLQGKPTKGVLSRFNERALEDSEHLYTLVIEEFTRADLSSVLGELLTYVEYRDRSVTLPYSGRPFRLAENMVILATYNPTDRSALEVDAALLRRLRVVELLPDPDQAVEILTSNGVALGLSEQAASVFNVHREDPRWAFRMPFGHGIFAGVRNEGELYELWDERIRRFLHGPWEDHPYAAEISQAYPWQSHKPAEG